MSRQEERDRYVGGMSLRRAGSNVRIPRRQMLTEEVYDSIMSLLMNHEVRPGERINIDALARMLGVSVTPVRETLARLEFDALVTKTPFVGYAATPLLTPKQLVDMYEVRLALEPIAARHAAAQATDDAIAEMTAAMAGMHLDSTGNRWENYRLVTVEDARFHAAIGQAAGNSFLRDSVERLHSHLHLYRLYFHSGIEQATVREHGPILEAFRKRDADAAEAAMRSHLKMARERLLEVAKHIQQRGSAT